uniref:SKP1 component dimerisation domain-containing protein n=1 Tax=Ditylenchus dipsaci TaxID=166011 RepID=A0A915DCK7_9BILA
MGICNTEAGVPIQDHVFFFNNTDSPKISCRTKDGEVIGVELAAIRQSHTFDNMYNDLNLAEDHSSFVFDMKVVSTTSLARSTPDVPEPVVQQENDTKARIWFTFTEEEKKFLDLPLQELFDLNTAASYLDIASLQLYSAQAIAGMVRDKIESKDHQGIRDMFGMPDDMTAEELEQIKKDTPWSNMTNPKSFIILRSRWLQFGSLLC